MKPVQILSHYEMNLICSEWFCFQIKFEMTHFSQTGERVQIIYNRSRIFFLLPIFPNCTYRVYQNHSFAQRSIHSVFIIAHSRAFIIAHSRAYTLISLSD